MDTTTDRQIPVLEGQLSIYDVLEQPERGTPAVSLQELPESLASRLIEEAGHWIWSGWANDKGYPYVRFDGRDQPAYRVIWELLVGPIPEGLELDHLCVTPMCCNPQHLEPVTHAENQRRIRERYTQCIHGHDWTDPKNVRTRKNGSRYCAECDRIKCRARYAAGKK